MTFFWILMVLVPLCGMFWAAFHSRRYVRDVADYLASGRVAGRYVLCVGDLASALSVITFVALCEQNYQCGVAMTFWNAIMTPVGMVISLTGYCLYRFRQTRCLSAGQFWEMRYSRSFRIVAATVRTLAEMVTNAIGPAIAVRFFIYFLDLPARVTVFGFTFSTYIVLVGLLLILALAIIWPGGRISLLITDSIQGIISYPIFVIFAVFILTRVSWFGDVAPVMLDRVPGQSFLNPMDVGELRDFNVFALIVTLTSNILNRAAWIGNDVTNAGKTPHEQKMASIFGTWRGGFSTTMMVLLSILVITVMLGGRFAQQSHGIRKMLVDKISQEVFAGEPDMTDAINLEVAKLPVPEHRIGIDPPYSSKNNPDIQFLDAALDTIHRRNGAAGNARYQEFRSLYFQMMMPTILRSILPPAMIALFTLLMIMLLLSTDDSRIFNASSTLIQDVILPFKKKTMSMETHLRYLKFCSLGVTLFFFVVSLFFAQLDYINMFVTIMCSVWMGASGPIMIGGLYTSWGNTVGAWCALFFGSGASVLGLFCQRNWAGLIYPWLEKRGLVETVAAVLEKVSAPLNPLIVWKMDPIKFPVNSMEIFFMAMLLGVVSYTAGSLLTYRKPYNLDRLFHRGIYSDRPEEPVPDKKKESFSIFRWIYVHLVGITSEYTRGDRIIAWIAFFYSLVFWFGIMFIGVLIWNLFFPFDSRAWAVYFFFRIVVMGILVGVISTVWFFVGGIRDLRALFRDLAARTVNPLDNGVVVGEVSLADRERFARLEEKLSENQKKSDKK